MERFLLFLPQSSLLQPYIPCSLTLSLFIMTIHTIFTIPLNFHTLQDSTKHFHLLIPMFLPQSFLLQPQMPCSPTLPFMPYPCLIFRSSVSFFFLNAKLSHSTPLSHVTSIYRLPVLSPKWRVYPFYYFSHLSYYHYYFNHNSTTEAYNPGIYPSIGLINWLMDE